MRKFLLFSALAVLVTGKPSEQISLKSKTIQDVSSSSAPAYWTAECGDRTYVGTYTLMMDWAECRDYCQYFPHAGELGHSFTFADILDTDTMECLRYNMNQQYTPGNGYAGHYWAGGYRGEDGQYRWDSGEPFTYDDFVGNPGTDPYIHLTPGNNYQWNTKSDQNDRNNGCLCKSEQSSSEAQIKESDCPEGWTDLGPYCLHYGEYGGEEGRWSGGAHEVCESYGSELMSWKDRSEYFPLKIFLLETCINAEDNVRSFCNWRFWTAASRLDNGQWVWRDTLEPVPMDFGWRSEPDPNNPRDSGHIEGGIGSLAQDGGGQIYPPLCKLKK